MNNTAFSWIFLSLYFLSTGLFFLGFIPYHDSSKLLTLGSVVEYRWVMSIFAGYISAMAILRSRNPLSALMVIELVTIGLMGVSIWVTYSSWVETASFVLEAVDESKYGFHPNFFGELVYSQSSAVAAMALWTIDRHLPKTKPEG